MVEVIAMTLLEFDMGVLVNPMTGEILQENIFAEGPPFDEIY
jgi:hypothetical protein